MCLDCGPEGVRVDNLYQSRGRNYELASRHYEAGSGNYESRRHNL